MRIKLTLVLLALALLGACVALTVCFWGWLRSGGEVEAANSETLQNVGLMTAGFLALIFAAWRAQVGRTASGGCSTASGGCSTASGDGGARCVE